MRSKKLTPYSRFTWHIILNMYGNVLFAWCNIRGLCEAMMTRRYKVTFLNMNRSFYLSMMSALNNIVIQQLTAAIASVCNSHRIHRSVHFQIDTPPWITFSRACVSTRWPTMVCIRYSVNSPVGRCTLIWRSLGWTVQGHIFCKGRNIHVSSRNTLV